MARSWGKAGLLAATLILAALAAPAGASKIDDAWAAYNKNDFDTAFRLFHALAERGDMRAQNAIGRMYARGEGVARDTDEAKKWFSLATVQDRALTAYNTGDFAAAKRGFEPLAEKGHILAEYILGLMYANGQGVPQSYPDAMKWHLKAAEQGEAKAQFSVGVMYFKGLRVAQNRAEAFKWYRRAADQGDPTAQFNLGAMYAKGETVTADPVTAYMLYSLAA